jgi:flagellar motor switch protein FliN/FliY
MARDLKTLLKLRVPVIVRLGHARMPLSNILRLAPGAIIELPQLADQPLDLMVNNKVVGRGAAVKIGENFGLRVTDVGAPQDRVAALATRPNDQ